MVAVLATKTGRNAVSLLADDQSFTFIEDGSEGPMDIPVRTLRADSPADALRIVASHRNGEASGFAGTAAQVSSSERRSSKVGRNQPCPCGSGLKYKRCCSEMYV